MKKQMKAGVFCLVFAVMGAAPIYSQQAVSLDAAIEEAARFLSARLPAKSVVAVTNFEAPARELSDHIIDELIVAFWNAGSVTVVERREMERKLLQEEIDFNSSGYVSDNTQQSIGKDVGAQIIISGSITPYRDIYRIRVQALVTETAQVAGALITNVKYDSVLTGYLGVMNPAEQWKYMCFYAGINAGYSATLNDYGYGYRENYFNLGPPIGFAVYAMVQPFDLFGIAFDLCNNFFGTHISLLPTLTLRPSSFEINFFVGCGISVHTYFDDLNTGDIVFLGGIRGGYHLGPGVIYAEVRPMGGDKGFFINMSLGYQIGFVPRKKR
jgi:hypothetical protein